jgi:cytidylate kinase
MLVTKIIAIDGPAGSGKSTLGEKLAKSLGYLYLDTGVMYRAVTLAALEKGVPVEDETGVSELTTQLQIDVQPASIQDGRAYDVLIDGHDVTWEIRRPEVEASVSMVSAYPGVRHALAAAQRRIGLRGQVVMVGRDIGTVVLPEADLKIYLDASVQERAKRRYNEMIARGQETELQTVLKSMQERDRIDSTRAMSPLRAAPDAVTLDSDHLDADQVFERVKELVDASCIS